MLNCLIQTTLPNSDVCGYYCDYLYESSLESHAFSHPFSRVYASHDKPHGGYVTDLDQRSQTFYTALCNGVVSHGAQIGGIRVFPTTHTEINANKMCPWSLCAIMLRFTHVYLHAQTAVNTSDVRTWWITVILIMGKTQIPHIGAPCRDENGNDSWISSLNLWV